MRTFKKGQKVYWNDPDKTSIGKHTVIDPYAERNADYTDEDVEEFDDRMILIGNDSGSETQVYAQELDCLPVKVIFRKWRRTGKIIALFPEELWNKSDYTVASYMHCGQHGGADYATVISRTTLAKQDEYADLLKELEQVGYNNLKVMQKCRPKFN